MGKGKAYTKEALPEHGNEIDIECIVATLSESALHAEIIIARRPSSVVGSLRSYELEAESSSAVVLVQHLDLFLQGIILFIKLEDNEYVIMVVDDNCHTLI